MVTILQQNKTKPTHHHHHHPPGYFSSPLAKSQDSLMYVPVFGKLENVILDWCVLTTCPPANLVGDQSQFCWCSDTRCISWIDYFWERASLYLSTIQNLKISGPSCLQSKYKEPPQPCQFTLPHAHQNPHSGSDWKPTEAHGFPGSGMRPLGHWFQQRNSKGMRNHRTERCLGTCPIWRKHLSLSSSNNLLLVFSL